MPRRRNKEHLFHLIVVISGKIARQTGERAEDLWTYEIRWSDLDANAHVNYAVYINAAGDVRYHFIRDHGFPPEKLEEIGMSQPVIAGRFSTTFSKPMGRERSSLRWKV